MNNIYYLATVCPRCYAFDMNPPYDILGVFSTRKNAEDVIVDYIRREYEKNFVENMSNEDEYTGEENDKAYEDWLYSNLNILDNMSEYYIIDRIEIDKVY